MSMTTSAPLRLPALATAHSHAFQRAMRGTSQRAGQGGDDFWTWRGQMYRLSTSLTREPTVTAMRATTSLSPDSTDRKKSEMQSSFFPTCLGKANRSSSPPVSGW